MNSTARDQFDDETEWEIDDVLSDNESSDPIFESGPSKRPRNQYEKLTQADVDRIVAKLNLTQAKSILLGRILKKRGATDLDFRISNYSQRSKELKKKFTLVNDGQTVYLSDLDGFFK